MYVHDSYFAESELAYRTARARRSIAARRGNRSRASWVRRVAAAAARD